MPTGFLPLKPMPELFNIALVLKLRCFFMLGHPKFGIEVRENDCRKRQNDARQCWRSRPRSPWDNRLRRCAEYCLVFLLRRCFQLFEFGAGFTHVCVEFVIGVQAGKTPGNNRLGSFYVTLPVVARNDAALAPFVTVFQQCVLVGGVDFGKQECHGPGADSIYR